VPRDPNYEVVAVGLNQWAIANRWSTGKHDAAPMTFADKRQKREFSKVSKVRLATSGLSGCIAVGLLSDDKFCLMHVYSDCNKTNWPEYNERMAECASRMGQITDAFVGYSDDVDLKNETYSLVSEWVGKVTTSVECSKVGGAVQMRPATDRVSFDAADKDDYVDASAVKDAGTFVKSSGWLSAKAEAEAAAEQ